MFEVLRDQFEIAPPEMQREIQSMHTGLIKILAHKGVDYSSLRSALVPKADRGEVAFIFDSTEIKSSHYGGEVFSHILPLLDPSTTQSVLVGDIRYLSRKLVRF